MTNIIGLVYIFFQKYLVPLLFVIGLMYFIYGCIEYFIIGKGGDESRAQHGRVLLLKSISWFAIALLVYLAIAFLGWIGFMVVNTDLQPARTSGDADVKIDRRSGTLDVPNAPSGNY